MNKEIKVTLKEESKNISNDFPDILVGIEPGIFLIRCNNCLCIPIFSIVPKLTEFPKLKIECNCGSYWKKINEFISLFQITLLTQINCFSCHNRENFYKVSFCYNCRKILCNNCFNSHIFTYSEHKIRTSDLIEINCKEHKEEVIIGFCVDCDKYFCQKCKDEHIFHSDKLDNIKESSINIKEIKEDLNEANKKVKFNEELKNKCSNNFKKSYEKYKQIEAKYNYNTEINNHILKVMDLLLNMYDYYKKKKQSLPYSLMKSIYKNKTFNLQTFNINYSEVSPDFYYKKIINYFNYDFIIKFTGERIRKKTNREIDYFEILERIIKLDKVNFGTSGTLILKDKRIATCSPNGDIIIFNQNLEKELTLTGHSEKVIYLYETDDGKLISFSSDQTIKVWILLNKHFKCHITFHSKNNFLSFFNK